MTVLAAAKPATARLPAGGTAAADSIGTLATSSPAPRFSRTRADTPPPPSAPGADGEAVLRDAGFDAARIAQLRADGAI